MVLFSGIGPPFVNPGVFPPGQHLDSHKEGASSQLVSVHPARRCTSPRGVVLVGLEDDVGDCHDAANLPKERLLFPPGFFWEKIPCFFSGNGFLFWILLDMLVA